MRSMGIKDDGMMCESWRILDGSLPTPGLSVIRIVPVTTEYFLGVKHARRLKSPHFKAAIAYHVHQVTIFFRKYEYRPTNYLVLIGGTANFCVLCNLECHQEPKFEYF